MKQYVVDAFTDKVFAGNPAAVCVMQQWLPDELMMSITNGTWKCYANSGQAPAR